MSIYNKQQRDYFMHLQLAEMFALMKFREEYPLASESDIIDIAYWLVDNQAGLSLGSMKRAFELLRDSRYRIACSRALAEGFKSSKDWKGGLPSGNSS